MTSPLPSNVFPEERRLATVLFADVQGFTSLAERLDFEVVSDLIKNVWLRIDTIIEQHGGYIDKHIGDAVMAVWGAPYAGESDAEQAVQAGLALQKAMIEEQNSSESGWSLVVGGPAGERGEQPIAGLALKLRVGINTGMVLAGYVGKRREYTVMGDAVNIASRLQNWADPDTVIIGEATFRLVRGAYLVRRLPEPLQLRGKTEPVQAYLVEGQLAQPSRLRYNSLDSLETIMVGRERDLRNMQAVYDQVVNEESPALLLVSSGPGMGKSRLLMEFANAVESGESPATVLSTRALAQATQVPFFLWKSLWFIRFGVQDTDPIDIQRQKLLREMQKVWGFQLGPASSVEAAHLIGSMIGVPYPESPYLNNFESDPKGRLKRTFELVRELFRRICAFRPALLIFDDLQYADTSSLMLLAYLLEPAPYPLPLMIIGSARPEFAQRQPRWLNLATLLELEPLPVNAEIISAAYPALRSLSAPVLERLADLADGNPYFMEELAKSVLKSGAAQEPGKTGILLANLQEQPPESLRVMLQARLGSLSHEARAVALLAAVVGRVFWVGAVLAAARADSSSAPSEDDKQNVIAELHQDERNPLAQLPADVLPRLIQDALRQLVRAELAFPRANSSYGEEQEYIFKHSLLREVAYGLLPRRTRPHYHLAVAEWLARRANNDFQLMAASHFELAHENVKAAEIYEATAEQIMLSGAIADAQGLLARAHKLRIQVTQSIVKEM